MKETILFYEGFNVSLKRSTSTPGPGAGVPANQDPLALCNYEYSLTSGSLPHSFESYYVLAYSDAGTGLYPGIIKNINTGIDPLSTQSTCDAAGFSWLSLPTPTSIDSCMGTLSCGNWNNINHLTCNNADGCRANTQCLGNYYCSDLSSFQCSTHPGCSTDANGACVPLSGHFTTLYCAITSSFDACDEGITACTFTYDCVNDGSCPDASSEPLCNSGLHYYGCNWATTDTTPDGVCSGTVMCEQYSTASCPTLEGCSLDPNPTYCAGSFSCTDLTTWTCESVNGCSVNVNVCVDDLDERNGIRQDLFNSFSDKGAHYADSFYDCADYFMHSTTGCVANAPSQCTTSSACVGTPSCSAGPDAGSSSTCVADDRLGCEWSYVESSSCSGNIALCSSLSSFQCSAHPDCFMNQDDACVPGCSADKYLCANNLQMVPTILQPIEDCNDFDSRNRCPPTPVHVIDADNDGFFAVIPNPTINSFILVGPPTVPLEASSIPGWFTATLGGAIWDADDNDPRETYIDCPPEQKFVYPEAGIVSATAAFDDHPLTLQLIPPYPAKYFGGCCAGNDCSSYQIFNSGVGVAENNNFNCEPSGTTISTGSLTTDKLIVCSPGDAALAGTPVTTTNNTWLDADADENACALVPGGVWAQSGHTTSANRLAVTPNNPFFTTQPEEYAKKLQYECCIDDGGKGVTATCDGSSSTISLCAPDNGKNYLISNGDLVEATSCPDIIRASPLWIDDSYISDSALLDTQLQTTATGYCCTLGAPSNLTKPLCDADGNGAMDATGCFIAESSLQSTLPYSLATNGVSGVEWCVQSGADDNCVIDGEFLKSSTSNSQITLYKQEVLVSTVLQNNNNGMTEFICTSYTPPTTTVSYMGSSCPASSLPPSCQAFNVTSCTPKNVTNGGILPFSFLPANTACIAVCQESSGEFNSCKEYCGDYLCEKKLIYEGPSCTVPAACQIPVTVTLPAVHIDSVSLPACISPATFPPDQCIGTECYLFSDTSPPSLRLIEESKLLNAPNNDQAIRTLGPLTAPTPNVINYNFNPVPGTNYCVPHGTVINVSGNEIICGDNSDDTDFGDFWCPEGFEYVPVTETCQLQEAICDMGNTGSVSCDPLLFSTPANDTYFNAYNSGCVESDSPSAVSNRVYDMTCCLAAVFNGFEIYKDNSGPNVDHIKIY